LDESLAIWAEMKLMELGWFQASSVLKQATGSGKRYGD
jgi:hypothetical protein